MSGGTSAANQELGLYELNLPGKAREYNGTTLGGNTGVDTAFRLEGEAFSTAAPEPASLTLLGIGCVSLLGYAGFRRRKARGAAAA